MKSRHFISALIAAVLAFSGCNSEKPGDGAASNDPGESPQTLSESVKKTFRPEKLAELDGVIEGAIADSKIVGAALWVERNGVAYHKAYGRRALKPESIAMSEDTIFDLASITKVVATTSATMLAVERGILKVDDRVLNYLPEFTGDGREKITIRHLLLHTSGLPVNLDVKTAPVHNRDEALAQACTLRPTFEPGTAFSYSSAGMIVLGAAVERATDKPLDEFCTAEVFRPLKMTDTIFRPAGDRLRRVALTSAPELGQVDDLTARMMGGVAGHASLFSTTADLARFARMMLDEGKLDGVRVFQPETVRLMTGVQSPDDLRSPEAENLLTRRGLGWDIDTPYRVPPHEYTRQRGKLFPVGGYGHAGWTGQMLWIDPFSRTFVIFLCNRYHGQGNQSPQDAYQYHSRIATLAAEAVKDFDFTNVPGALPKASGEPVVPQK